MISRRNIRVKVMQLLYIIETVHDQQAFKNPVSELQKQIDQSKALFVYLIYFLTEFKLPFALKSRGKHLFFQNR